MVPGVDSLSILFDHRSFRKPAVFPGSLEVSGKIRIPRKNFEMEGTPRIVLLDLRFSRELKHLPGTAQH